MNDRSRESQDVIRAAPGGRTLVEQLPSPVEGLPVQRHASRGAQEGATSRRASSDWDFSQLSFSSGADGASADGASADDTSAAAVEHAAPAERARVHRAAAHGFSGAARPLPFLEIIQSAFGAHDVRGVRAYIGGPAADAAAAMNAAGFASRERVAFAAPPDLFLAAHEAAHVVQQRHGVQLSDGVGEAGDEHERHANQVATLVTQGASAEALLDRYGDARAGAAAGDQGPVQHFREDTDSNTRLSENGNLMVQRGSAYATKKSIAESNAILKGQNAGLRITAGKKKAEIPERLTPEGTDQGALAELFEVVVKYQPPNKSDPPSGTLPTAANKFNLKPKLYQAEVTARIKNLNSLLEKLEAFQAANGSEDFDLEKADAEFARWHGSVKNIDQSFLLDFNGPGSYLRANTSWEGFAKFLEQIISIRDSYQRDLKPENLDRMILPGDCGDAAKTLLPKSDITMGDRLPKVGDRLKIDFTVAKQPHGWSYHYASTVLADGEDIVTLETAADPRLPKLTRSNWQFKLYGKGEQSFWSQSWDEYAKSMAERGQPLPPDLVAKQKRLALRTSEASSSGARAPEAEVLPRSEQLADELEVAGQRAGEVAQASMHDAAQGTSRASEAALRTAARAARAHIDRSFIRAGEVLGPYLRPLGKVVVVAALIYDSVKVVLALIADHKLGDQRMTKTRDELGGVVGAWTGMFAGGYAGAALGTAIWPGFGTFVGALLGGVAGGLLGSAVVSRIANTSFIGNLVQKWNDFWWPATAEGNAMKAKEPEVTAQLEDSLAAQAEVFAEAYRKDPAVKLYRNVVWKLQWKPSFWKTIATAGRYRTVFKSADIVSAKLELTPGQQSRIFDTKALTEIRSQTTETTLADLLGEDPSRMGSSHGRRAKEDDNGPHPHHEGEDGGTAAGTDNGTGGGSGSSDGGNGVTTSDGSTSNGTGSNGVTTSDGSTSNGTGSNGVTTSDGATSNGTGSNGVTTGKGRGTGSLGVTTGSASNGNGVTTSKGRGTSSSGPSLGLGDAAT